MKTMPALIGLLSATIFLACEKEHYEGCCGTSATSFTIGNGHLFMPNIFTPNGDGINDVYLPYSDTNIVAIEKFVIRNAKGDILFSTKDGRPNDPGDGWSGNISNRYQGKFKYLMEVRSADGTIETIEGSACSYPFENEEEEVKVNCETCQFGTQHDGAGGFCENCNPFENFLCQ